MKALNGIKLESILFVDIETVNLVPKLEKGTPIYNSWEYKQRFSRDKVDITNDEVLLKSYDDSGALYPEFAKIVCISIGMVQNDSLKVKSYCDHDEAKLLKEFTVALNKMPKGTILGGHFIKGFDLPFILRRSIVNGIEPASMIDFGNAKPWDIQLVDTYDLWKGLAINSASLINIATALGIPSPKDDIAGYQVAATYWSGEKGRLERIAKYCEKDILCVANIIRKFMYLPLIDFAGKPVDEQPEKPLLTRLFEGAKYGIKEATELTEHYQTLTTKEKKAAQLILQSVITKNTGFTQEHLDALINYKKVKNG